MPQISMLHLCKRQLKRKLKYTAFAMGMISSVFLGNIVMKSAMADDALFLIPSLTIEESGDSEVDAKKKALVSAKRQAYQTLINMVVPVRQRSKMPNLTDKQIENLVYTTDIPSERMSQGAGLYVADIQIGFRPDLMRDFFKKNRIAFSETRSRPLLVIPVLTQDGDLRLWEDTNDWRFAWANSEFEAGLVPIEQPLGDISDISELTSDEALALNQEKLLGIANKYGASGVILSIADLQIDATTQQQSMSVSNVVIAEGWTDDLTVYDFFQPTLPETADTNADIPSSATVTAGLYAKAIDVVYSSLQERWKEANLIDPNVQGNSLLMNVPLADLKDWLRIRSMLDRMTMVQKYRIVNINVEEANIVIEYSGRTDSLQSALKQLRYDLAYNSEEQGWSLLKR